MSTHKAIDKLCVAAVVLSLLLAIQFMNGEALGIQSADRIMGYEDRLFDTGTVHTIDIIMDDWNSFIESCENEEYALCELTIDGETYKNVGIRAKGNTSLSSVSSMNSDRYSFKIEFDQYDSTQSYHGLDKLSLNNLIQDNTFMKDYLVYQMMAAFDVATPLCSYVYITVNGEDWGLYLAVESIEESFLQRNYGSDYGELYKPDSMNMGGGRGNGQDFDMADLDFDSIEPNTGSSPDLSPPSESGSAGSQSQPRESRDNTGGTGFPSGERDGFSFDIDKGALRSALEEQGVDPTILDEYDLDNLSLETVQELLAQLDGVDMMALMQSVMGSFDMSGITENFGNIGGGGTGGMGSSDVKLQYIDDDPDSYTNIFSSAKTDVSDADQERLIQSLKVLSESEDIENVLNVDQVLRYFVVHNFVVNGDSYTGSMVHNYYLYEEDGQLSMLPWDYNLAFGTFQGSNASNAVNDDIDAPLSVTGSGDRPMIDWIFSSEEYTELYHQYFASFIETCLDSGWFTELVESTAQLIAPYVERDPSKFCTYEEFEAGVEAIGEFGLLRAESVSAQLAGQEANIDTGDLQLSDMGTMGSTMGGGFSRDEFSGENSFTTESSNGQNGWGAFPGSNTQAPGANGTQPSDEFPASEGSASSGGMTPPGGSMPSGDMTIPEGSAPSGNTAQPGGSASGDSSDTAPESFDGHGFSNDMSVSFGGFSQTASKPETPSGSGNALVLLGVSLLALTAGLLLAAKFKRR